MESSTATKKQRETARTNSNNSKPLSPICAEDVVQVRQPMECRVSPDGRWLVLTVQFTTEGAKGNYSNLYLLPLQDVLKPAGISAQVFGDQQLRQLTFGEHE